uniref:NAC transcription factor 81 n=1 Tax=Litchi chinensis TaxID=151069 RepID=A0A8K1MC00_LITCN|nr:NAC transcription factor 81 [Litchi chinensis]
MQGAERNLMMMMMPTGFRFNPTDEELIQILETKASGQPMPPHFSFIVQRNVYEHDPQHLQWDQTTAVADNERYCYCMKDNDSREVSGQGWWKATGHVKKIYASNNQSFVGYKRPLTFHRFKDNKKKRNEAIKTNWIMHEYSLVSITTDWRLCRVKYKGKPSAQEELENVRKASCSTGTQPDLIGEENPDQMNYEHEADQFAEDTQLQVVDEQEQQSISAFISNDPFQTQFSTNYYLGDQIEQTDSSEQLFPTLWSWQN